MPEALNWGKAVRWPEKNGATSPLPTPPPVFWGCLSHTLTMVGTVVWLSVRGITLPSPCHSCCLHALTEKDSLPLPQGVGPALPGGAGPVLWHPQLQAASQNTDSQMCLEGNLGRRCQHESWPYQDHQPIHGPHQLHGPLDLNMASGGYPCHSHQHGPQMQQSPRTSPNPQAEAQIALSAWMSDFLVLGGRSMDHRHQHGFWSYHGSQWSFDEVQSR